METLEPSTAEELSALLRDAGAQGRALVPVGGGTKACSFTPPDGAWLSVKRLPTTLAHFPGDLVATLPAGARLRDVNDALAKAGQWLPLDPPFSDRATIGGIVAANDSGPRRHRYGAPRDLIIGIDMTLADGQGVKAGGRVVKNVAGYDLSRLLCGSFGSLAVITSATFKLAPVAPASATVVAPLSDAGRLAPLLQDLAESPFTPSAVEIDTPPARLLLRFETTPASARHMAAAASAICARHGAEPATLEGSAEAEAWTDVEGGVWSGDGAVVKLAVPPTEVAPALDEVQESSARESVDWHASGRAALGVLFVRLDGDSSALGRLIAEWRGAAARRHGSLVVQRLRPALTGIGRWGEVGDALKMMRSVKARFDPRGILSPGLGPGGL